MTKQKNKAVNSIDLTKREQKFVNLLTDKLIDVAHNPKLRKGFKVEGIGLGQYYFYSNDVPSEIERIGLFFFNMLEGENNRAFFWIEQVQDENIKGSLLAKYYALLAQEEDEQDNIESAIDNYRKYIEYAVSTSEGVSCLLLRNYVNNLLSVATIHEFLVVAVKILAIGLHSLDVTDDNILSFTNTYYSAEQVDLIKFVLECFEKFITHVKDDKMLLYLKLVHSYESAYFYACTGRIGLAKEQFSKWKELCKSNGMEEYGSLGDMYDFRGMTDDEKEERHEWFIITLSDFIRPYFEEGSTLPIEQVFDLEPQKQPRPKKGSFDWLYIQAEKGYLAKLSHKATEQDYANMRAVAEAYRTGNGVRQNLRLAECWEEMAQP